MVGRSALLLFVLLVAAVAGPCEPLGRLARADERPNVVLIVADDLGWSDCSLYQANAWHPTNALRRIAEAGTTFDRAYACPLCSASRGDLISGRSSARTQLTDASGHKPDAYVDAVALTSGPAVNPAANVRSASRLKAGYVTIAETFQAAGYATGQFGKWHVGDGPHGPANQGFDVHLPDVLDRAGPPQGGYLGWSAPTMDPSPASEHVEDRMRKEVCGFLSDHRDEPFFVYYAMFSVHGPWEAKPDLLAEYQAASPAGRSPTYGAMVETMSLNVGAVLNTLESLGLEEETIVVFASDNGGNVHDSAPGEGVPVTTNAPLRGGKGTLWEGGIRVPLVIRAPGISLGDHCGEPVRIEDLYPTLCELCDLTPPAGLDGVSLVPALAGDPLARERVYTFFPHSTGVPDRTLAGATVHDREGWKLLREFHAGVCGGHRERLFYLPTDPDETDDVGQTFPGKRAELAASLDAFLSGTGAVLPLANPLFAP